MKYQSLAPELVRQKEAFKATRVSIWPTNRPGYEREIRAAMKKHDTDNILQAAAILLGGKFSTGGQWVMPIAVEMMEEELRKAKK